MKKRWKLFGLIFLSAVIIFSILVTLFSIAPKDFPNREVVTIPSGSSVTTAGSTLEQHHIIRYIWMYRVYVILLSRGSGIQAGSYLFDKTESALRVAYRTANNIQGLAKIKITIPEGSNSKTITSLLSKNIPNFASSTFYLLAKDREGYLFPDTYFFYENTGPQQVIDEMNLNFNNQLATVSTDIRKFGKPLIDVIKLASIVEKEATSSIDRRIIAGILWSRIAKKYPLQVDPPFFYFLGKDSSQITFKDLAIDSPYNLYKHIGLPPTPIDNPGLQTIIDTINPTSTKYWYYLSDEKGVMHYAVTYDQHLANKAKYVK